MSYCDSTVEQEQNPHAKDLMTLIANGDMAAFNWMWDFWCFTHAIDDVIDKDKPVNSSQMAEALARFVSCLSINPFFLHNSYSLHPLIISACNRWVDGDKLKSSANERDRIHSEVVRCGDIEIYLHAAYLIGGWEHMRKCSNVARLYDKSENV